MLNQQTTPNTTTTTGTDAGAGVGAEQIIIKHILTLFNEYPHTVAATVTKTLNLSWGSDITAPELEDLLNSWEKLTPNSAQNLLGTIMYDETGDPRNLKLDETAILETIPGINP